MAENQSPATKPARIVYQASGVRRTTLAIAFLLLLPFVASVPIMLFQRVTHGIWIGTFGLMVLGAGMFAILAMLAINLMQALRARVVLGEEAVELTLPAGRGPTPLLRYASHKVRYDEVRAVETRGEVYGNRIAPVLLKGARVITKDGASIRLGYVNEYNADPQIPVLEIGRQIAERAGIDVLDKGAVQRSVGRKANLPMLSVLEPTPSTTPLPPDEIAAINARHRMMTIGIAGVVVLAIVAGIVVDALGPPPGGSPRLAAPAKSTPAKAKTTR